MSAVTLEELETDEQIVLMSLKFGLIGEVEVNYKRNYIGSFFPAITLHGGYTPSAWVESYFGKDISSYTYKGGQDAQQPQKTYLTLTIMQNW